MNDFHSLPAESVANTSRLVKAGEVLSLLPIHTPTASSGWLLLDGLGRKPYVDTSLTQLVVPVLSAMMRRRPPGPFRSWKFLPQYGFWAGSELPARMFVVIHAACGLQTLRLTGVPGL